MKKLQEEELLPIRSSDQAFLPEIDHKMGRNVSRLIDFIIGFSASFRAGSGTISAQFTGEDEYFTAKVGINRYDVDTNVLVLKMAMDSSFTGEISQILKGSSRFHDVMGYFGISLCRMDYYYPDGHEKSRDPDSIPPVSNQIEFPTNVTPNILPAEFSLRQSSVTPLAIATRDAINNIIQDRAIILQDVFNGKISPREAADIAKKGRQNEPEPPLKTPRVEALLKRYGAKMIEIK